MIQTLNLGKLFYRGGSGTGSQLVNWLAGHLLGPQAFGHVVRGYRHLARRCMTVVIQCDCLYVLAKPVSHQCEWM